jgi:hypothetical protein
MFNKKRRIDKKLVPRNENVEWAKFMLDIRQV